MVRWPRLWLAVATALAAALVQHQVLGQTVARADAAISGVVVDASTRQPIPDAVVQLGSLGQRDYPDIQSRQFSDERGRFVFTDLPASPTYTLTVVKSGYFDGAYGRVGCLASTLGTIAVTAGQWFSDATVTLCRPGSLSGTVTNERGEPVIGVYVRALMVTRVAGRDRYAVGPLVTTDDRGLYRIGRLTPGRYVVMVPSVQASVPAATLAAALQSQALSLQSVGGFQSASASRSASAPMIDVDATTRLGVGGYPIPPPPVNGRALTYPAAFSSGTSLADAATVELGAGEDRSGVDMHLVPARALRISGVVQGPPDAIAGAILRLLADGAEDLGASGETGTSVVAPDGSFVFANVPAGRYTIEAPISVNQYTQGDSAESMFYGPQLPRQLGVTGAISTMESSVPGASNGVGFSTTTFRSRKYWGRATVSLEVDDVTGVVVTLRPSGSITGRVVGETDPHQPAPASPPQFVRLETATGAVWEGAPPSGQPAHPGEFTVDGVLPGLYVFRGDSPPWMIKSVAVNGRDYTDTPLDTTATQGFSGVVVTFTNAIPSLTGTVREANGAPVTHASVIIFPVEAEQWTNFGLSPSRIKSVPTSSAGTFRLRSIPAGDYFVVAVPETQSSAWQELDFFKRAQAVATRLSIAWGEQKTADLRVTEVR